MSAWNPSNLTGLHPTSRPTEKRQDIEFAEKDAQLRRDVHELGVVVGEPVMFRFFGSTVRRQDRVGTELEAWKEGELEELAPIEVTLPAEGRSAGEVVSVRLHASVTEVGTLLLEAVPTQPRKPDERWRVELSVRSE
jgi:hypothetical protein